MDAWKVKHAAMREEWKTKIVECRQSKTPVREWCQIHGVSPKTYYRWEREIVGLASEEMAEHKRLEREVYQWPRSGDEARELTPQQYRWLMEGLKVDHKAHREMTGLTVV